jgi:hypothetical protein
MSSLLPAIEDLNTMLPSPESSPALAFPFIWHTITTALNNILPSQQNIPSPLLPNEPEQLWSTFTHKQQDKIQYTPCPAIFTGISTKHWPKTTKRTSLTDTVLSLSPINTHH